MSREVELIIRAKDEASKFVDSITDSLKNLTDVQQDVGKSAQATGSLLEQLGKEFKELNNEAKRLSSLGKMAENLDRSASAVKNLGSSVGESASEFAEFSREGAKAAGTLDKLRNALETEQASLKANTAARRDASKELTAVNRAVAQAERNQDRYNKTLGNTPDQFVRPAARSAGTFIAADVERSRAAQAKLTKDVADYEAAITNSKQAVEQLRPQVQAAARQQAVLAEQTEKASGSLSKNLDTLGRAKTAYGGLSESAAQASTALGGIVVTQDEVARASARVAAEIARTKAQIEGLSKVPRASAPAADISGDIKDTPARKAAIERLRDLRKEMVQAQADAQRLNSTLKSTATPTTELGTAAGQAQVRVRDLKTELTDLRTRLRQTEGGFRSWSQSVTQVRNATSGTAMTANQLALAANAAAAGIRPLGSAAQGAAQGMESATRGGNGFRTALNGIYGDSRKALSLMQRVRGEVLALATAYIGLQAAISNIGGVINAFQTLEGAQSRLGAVFNQDTGRVAKELEFLQRQADRLGIQFGILADQYGKFAVAAASANFTVAETRKVFLSVAEAARVNKLSQEQLEGVFKALEQMISKGKVSAEELRGQLGDRMSGAFQIFAAAIGVTTAQLDKMMKDGEVLANSSNLIKFADELNKRFGPQLSAALAGTTAELGRFSNNIFDAQVLVGQGGFIESFTNGLRRLNTFFQSREGRDFFLSIGAALAKFTDALAIVPRYFDEITTALQVFTAVKVAGFLTNLLSSFKGATVAATSFSRSITLVGPPTQQMVQQQTALSRVLASSVSQLAIWQNTLARAGGGLRAMGVVLGGLRTLVITMTGLFRTLWAAIGGLPGLILTGVTVAIGQWATQIDSATTALDEHQRQMQAIIGAYEQAKGKVTDWSKAVKGVTVSQAEDNLSKLLDSYTERFGEVQHAARGARTILQSFQGPLGRLNAEGFGLNEVDNLTKMINALDEAAKTRNLDQLRTKLDEVARATSKEGLKDLAVTLQNMLDQAGEGGQTLTALSDAIDRSTKNLKLLRGEVTETEAGLTDLSGASEKAADPQKKLVEETGKLVDAFDEMGKLIPGVADSLKKLETIDGLNKQYQDAIKLARTMSEVMGLTDRYNKAMANVEFGNLGGSTAEASFNLIKKFEGFQPTAKWDVNHFRAGFGSDTVTLADGSIQKVVEGMSVTMTDAIRDLNRRIEEFANTVKGEIGEDRFNSFSPQQQAVLTSVAYNYGNLTKTGALDTFKTGSVQEIADAIRGLSGHNDGINSRRRQSEAALFEGGGDDDSMSSKAFENERKRVEKAKEYNEDLTTRLALQENENGNAGRLTKEAFIQKQLAEEERKAKAAGVTLDQEQIARIQQAAAAEFELKNQKVEGSAATKEANLALQQAVALGQQRNALQAQFNEAQKLGDAGAAMTAQTQLQSVNAQLSEAIEKARAMWEAIGGEQAQVALTKLDTLKIKAGTAANSMSFFGLSTQQVGQLTGSFADGLVGAFDSFAQAVANGENAMQALGQAFLQFAANFLREIATMILKQLILNALQSFMGGGMPMGHTGGLVGGAGIGSGNMRKASPLAAGIVRYHTGGIAGLKPDEVPAVLREGEEVLTPQDPNHRNNRTSATKDGAGSPGQSIKQVLVLNERELADAMATSHGEKVIVTSIKRNAATIKKILG